MHRIQVKPGIVTVWTFLILEEVKAKRFTDNVSLTH